MVTIGAIPEFGSDESSTGPALEEVVESTPEAAPVEPSPEGPETPADPLPANVPDPLEKQVTALATEREKLLNEIKSLRGQKREIKQDQINTVSQQIDDLKDVNPDDVSVIEKVLRSKGYVRQDEVQKMYYESAKNDSLEKFLDKYPEYKPENDPNDINWSALQRELGYYRMPDDPKKVIDVLERAHKTLVPAKPDTTVQARRQQVAVAGHGSGGVQRSAPIQTGRGLSEAQKTELLRGGWTQEEIKNY